jgi:nitroimidazol reductase NimA-like FMN-containing flavoprotein (pyridoxamine 5'-phosphate oxidase superfamily)
MNMSTSERDAYLQELHVGVISIEQVDMAPLSAPIWYDYDPAVGLWILTSPTSKKGKALATAQRFTLVAQNETAPIYKYVSVAGTIIEERVADSEKDIKPMAYRYFDRDTADRYLKSLVEGTSNYYLMRPEQWLTLDYSKM